MAKEVLDALAGIFPADALLSEPEDLVPYAFDGTAAISQMPAAVVFASSTSEVSRLLAAANAVHPNLVRRGGGVRAIELRDLPTPCGPALVVHLLVDVADAMGANIVNTLVEAVAPEIAALAGGEPRLCILTNLADRRLARASVRLPFEVLRTSTLDGRELATRVVEAWALAAARFSPALLYVVLMQASVSWFMPTSMTVAPGLTKSRVTKPARPIATTSRLASRATAGRSAVRE